jgi:hypothetical protein
MVTTRAKAATTGETRRYGKLIQIDLTLGPDPRRRKIPRRVTVSFQGDRIAENGSERGLFIKQW